jgi:hypothetical protein
MARPGQSRRCPADSHTTGTRDRSASDRTCRHAHAGKRVEPTATAPTMCSSSTAARPPTWSACRWLRITNGIREIPRRLRHPAIAPGSGPVSTRTARPCSAVESTTPSPCPTSHATADQPDGGHPGVRTRTGITTTSTPTTAAITKPRNRFRRSTRTTAPSSNASSNPPHQSAGHAIAAPGNAAACRPTVIIQSSSGPAT